MTSPPTLARAPARSHSKCPVAASILCESSPSPSQAVPCNRSVGVFRFLKSAFDSANSAGRSNSEARNACNADLSGTVADSPVGDSFRLRARHIKPWRDSMNQEQLYGHNSLLLAPHVDHLFDRRLITFSVLISSRFEPDVLAAWGLKKRDVGGLSEGQERHLEYHRTKVFKANMPGTLDRRCTLDV